MKCEVPVQTMKAYMGVVLLLQLFLTSAPDGVVVVIFTPPDRLASLEVSPGTRRTGCWVYPRARLDFLVVGKFLAPVGNRPTVA